MEEYFVDIVEVNPCRICSSLEGTLNILTNQLEEEGGVLLHEALEFVTCLKVDTDDGMAQSLCLICRGRLLDAFQFKNQALDSCKAFYDISSSKTANVKVDLLDGDDTKLHLDLNSDELADNISKEVDTLSEGIKADIDMSTDAVTFFIEHDLKNSKQKEPPEGLYCSKWPSHSPSQNYSSAEQNKYECQVCERRFRKKSNLIDHLRLHANVKKFVCSYCNKSFVQIANYRTHLRIHTKERPFQCSICQKTYNQSSTLKVHIRSHTQERNYVCTVCNKGFTNSSDLGKHRKVHDRSQQFKCEYCGKYFAQKVNMRIHQKKHHLKT